MFFQKFSLLYNNQTVYNLACFILLSLLCLYVLAGITPCIGLYTDAVNPDYLATHFFNSGNKLYSISNIYTGKIPLLGQFYHGTFTAFISALVISITGTTSTFQLFFTNSLYGVFISLVLMNILKTLGVNKVYSFISAVILLLSPCFYSNFFTQYYMELPGILFIFLSISIIIKTNLNLKHFFLVGLFVGFSIYTYFNFIFFIPAIVYGVLRQRSYINYFKRLLILFIGISIPCSLYLLAYEHLFLTALHFDDSKVKFIMLFTLLSIICVSFLLYKRNTRRYFLISSSIYLSVLFIVFFIISSNVFVQYKYLFDDLNVSGASVSFGERLSLLVGFVVQALTKPPVDYLILSHSTSTGMKVFPIFTFISVSLYLILNYKKKNDSSFFVILFLLIAFFTYILCAIPFASRLQGQHFIVLYLLMMTLLFVSVFSIYTQIGSPLFKKKFESILLTTYPVIVLLFLFNHSSIIFNLHNSPNDHNYINRKYSTSINILSNSALESQKQGIKNYYIFPEWGIMEGFSFLTMSSVPHSNLLNGNKDVLNYIHSKLNYPIKVCFWDINNKDKYISDINSIFGHVQIHEGTVRGNYADIYVLSID